MDARCCLSGASDGDRPSCYTESRPRARKEHECCECREVIPVGAHYENVTGIWDGSPGRYKTCLSCVEIRDHFACDGSLFGHLWEDLRESFFPTMTAGGPCMEGLSPEAKGRLFERRLHWYETVGARSNRWRGRFT